MTGRRHTRTIRELQALGIDERVLEFRKWRREQRLALKDVSLLLDVSPHSVMRLELGIIRRSRLRLPQRMRALMRVWREDLRPQRVKRKRGRKTSKLKPMVKCKGEAA